MVALKKSIRLKHLALLGSPYRDFYTEAVIAFDSITTAIGYMETLGFVIKKIYRNGVDGDYYWEASYPGRFPQEHPFVVYEESADSYRRHLASLG